MDPIRYIFEKPALSGRIAKWQMLLSEYDIQFVSQKAIKGSIIAEYLADRAVDDYEPMRMDFPDGDVMEIDHGNNEAREECGMWRMAFDGASNALGQGVGAVIISPDGRQYPLTAKLTFPTCTNNIAEYEACAMGLKMALEMKIQELEVYGDSALVIYQLNGEWQTRDSKLIPYQKYIHGLTKGFKKISFHHIPREENQISDALATLAAMYKIDNQNPTLTFEMKVSDTPAYCTNVEEEKDGKPWFYDIKVYLQEQVYPPGATHSDKKFLRRLSMSFFLNGDVLYKRSPDMVLLRCMDAKEANRIMEEIHEGVCGAYTNGHTMAK